MLAIAVHRNLWRNGAKKEGERREELGKTTAGIGHDARPYPSYYDNTAVVFLCTILHSG